MSDIPRLIFQWNAATLSMRCLSNRALDYFVDGERYLLEAREERSGKQHRWFFRAIHKVWQNALPEEVAHRFPSSEHLRKWALVHAGFADEDTTVMDSPEDAAKFAAGIRRRDDFAVISVSGRTVKVFTAKSQGVRHMNKKQFHESVEGVIRVICDLTGNTPDEFKSAGEQ